MKYLLDTHIVLWALADVKRLNDEIRALIEDTNNIVFYSVVSVWEVAIKHAIHPDQMPLSEEEFVSLCERTGFTELAMKNEHIYTVKTLKYAEKAPRHNDPFDRMLIAQAKKENLSFITHDALLEGYNESCIIMV